MTHATVDSHADHLNLGLFRFGPNYHNMSKQGRTGPPSQRPNPRVQHYMATNNRYGCAPQSHYSYKLRTSTAICSCMKQ